MKNILKSFVTIGLVFGLSACSTQKVQTNEFSEIPEGAVSIENCVENLYSRDRSAYDKWKKVYSDLHPSYNVYDAGDSCALRNGEQLVSFSYFEMEENMTNGGQSVALFSESGELIRETQGLSVKTPGDLSYPHIIGMQNNIISIGIGGGDAGCTMGKEYEVDYESFTITLTREFENCIE